MIIAVTIRRERGLLSCVCVLLWSSSKQKLELGWSSWILFPAVENNKQAIPVNLLLSQVSLLTIIKKSLQRQVSSFFSLVSPPLQSYHPKSKQTNEPSSLIKLKHGIIEVQLVGFHCIPSLQSSLIKFSVTFLLPLEIANISTLTNAHWSKCGNILWSLCVVTSNERTVLVEEIISHNNRRRPNRRLSQHTKDRQIVVALLRRNICPLLLRLYLQLRFPFTPLEKVFFFVVVFFSFLDDCFVRDLFTLFFGSHSHRLELARSCRIPFPRFFFFVAVVVMVLSANRWTISNGVHGDSRDTKECSSKRRRREFLPKSHRARFIPSVHSSKLNHLPSSSSSSQEQQSSRLVFPCLVCLFVLAWLADFELSRSDWTPFWMNEVPPRQQVLWLAWPPPSAWWCRVVWVDRFERIIDSHHPSIQNDRPERVQHQGGVPFQATQRFGGEEWQPVYCQVQGCRRKCFHWGKLLLDFMKIHLASR